MAKMAKMAKMMGFSRGVDVMRVSSAGRAIDGRRTERHGGCTGLRSFVRGRVGRVLERGATATAFASTSPAVLLTREESKNDKLRALLEGRGYETFELPLVEHTRNEGGRADLVHELAGGEGRVDWFITTSPEAAVVFTDCWREAGSPRWPRVASIGKGTTRALEENSAGGLIGFTPSKATGKVLARELPFPDGGAPIVVYPSSELASGDVEAGLGSRGFRVRRINTYGTRPVESLTEAQVQAASAAEGESHQGQKQARIEAKIVERKRES
uniref:Uroporphyrinogen-III synthase n=1 Tax=Chloropicon roscoffensis TaxID=1461544 RepID=A0A7S3CFX0_9CHLO|mmetsp:Transcript_8618/g.25959  ORF Transcript_8618/g.25959 Transcript_8618/m.25959 type:complete len:271 (+) Transcript_8618:22-834(+)